MLSIRQTIFRRKNQFEIFLLQIELHELLFDSPLLNRPVERWLLVLVSYTKAVQRRYISLRASSFNCVIMERQSICKHEECR